MSCEDRETGKDMRLVGEKYCIDCPDPEACHQGAPCDLVRVVAENNMDGARAQFVVVDEVQNLPETDEEKTERLNRTNNVWVIDKPKGNNVPTSDQAKAKAKEPQLPEADDYGQADDSSDEKLQEFKAAESKIRTWVGEVQPEKILAYGVLIAAIFGLGRRKTPKRTRVDYHHYIHTEKEKDKK